ncbi:MAG: HNH endonuclease [Pseudomonadota bacterium]
MPLAAPRPCTYPGCTQLVKSGSRCAKHVAKVRREVDERRGTARERGYDTAWQKAREGFLRAHPLCVECDRAGRAVPATVVDHIVPHRGDRTAFWDRSNWQPLCKRCHDAKTAREDGGFGRQGGV